MILSQGEKIDGSAEGDLRRKIREVIKAIEAGETRPKRNGKKVYRQEFGEAFLDMLKKGLD